MPKKEPQELTHQEFFIQSYQKSNPSACTSARDIYEPRVV